MFDKLAAVIPVRMGSSRVSNKVLLPIGKDNLSLLEWKITQLKEVLPSRNIYVSTESEELKKIAIDNGVQVHNRDFYLADGHKAEFHEVITGVVKDIPFEHIAWTTAVVPLMTPMEYLEAFQAYLNSVVSKGEFDSLVSVNLMKEYFWDDHSPINYQADKKHTISQDLPNIYRVTNGLYMRSKKDILKGEYLLGANPLKFEVSAIGGVDIDVYEDYEIANALTSLYYERIKGVGVTR